MTAKSARKWSGTKPERCDICERPFGRYFIDGVTRTGAWGLMCETCHRQHGRGLGIGLGQKYDIATLERVSQ